MKKQIAILSLTAVVAGVGLTGFSTAHAMQQGEGNRLAESIATTFNLDATKVQEAIDTYHKDRHAEHESKLSTHRDEVFKKLVADGTLTQTQADALKAKQDTRREEHQAERKAMRHLSKYERKEKMSEKRAERENKQKEMEDWAKEQGIDLEKVRQALHADRIDRHGDNHSMREAKQ